MSHPPLPEPEEGYWSADLPTISTAAQKFLAAARDCGDDLTAPELRAGIALQLREIERLRAEIDALRPDAEAYRSMGGRPLAHEVDPC